jgi:iron complex transport system substrate-binding protein
MLFKILLLTLKMLFFLNTCVFLFSCTIEETHHRTGSNRIISLSPHITEILYALDAQEELVAVTDYCLYPLNAQKKERIGGLLNPNIEKIVMLHPTILLGMPSHQKLNQELQRFNLSVLMMPNEKIVDVLETIDRIGLEIGHLKAANSLKENIENSLDSLRSISKSALPLRAMLIIGKDTYINEIWTILGGENVFADLPTRYATVNLETIITRNPDIIIEFRIDEQHLVQRQEVTEEWKFLANLNSVKTKNIFLISGDHTLIPGPRLVLLARECFQIIKLSIQS